MDVNEDNTEFTFTLREGLKWSDGVPVTTRDIRFAWRGCASSTRSTPRRARGAVLRRAARLENDPMTLEIIDDYTFKCTLQPSLYGGFPVALWPSRLALVRRAAQAAALPEQFHPDYADPDELEALIAENNFETWVQLYSFKDATQLGLLASACIGCPS